MVSLGKYLGYDYNWSLAHQAAHQPLLYINENIKVSHNSTDGTHPPVVEANTMFYKVKETSVTVDSNSTDNNVYPASTTVTNYDHEAVFLPTAFTVDWDSTSCSSTGAAGTYYTICTGAEDVSSTSIGFGIIQHTTAVTSFSFDESKGGWYDSNGNKLLARFNSTGGTVDQLTVFYSKTKDRGFYASKGLYFSSTGVYLSKGQFDLNGKTVEFKDDIRIQDTSTLMNNLWFIAYIDENDGTVNWTNSTNASWDNYTPSGNQLALMAVFNEERNYCYDTIVTDNARFIATAYMGNSSGTDGEYVFNLKQKPKTKVYCYNNTAQGIENNTITRVNFDAIEYDLLSEITTGASTWVWRATDTKNIIFNGRAWTLSLSGASSSEYMSAYIHKNENSTRYENSMEQTVGTVTRSIFQADAVLNAAKDVTYDMRIYANTGSSFTLHVGERDSSIRITEV